MSKKKKKNGTKILIAILILLVIGAGGVLGYKIIKDRENAETSVEEGQDNERITAVIEEKRSEGQ